MSDNNEIETFKCERCSKSFPEDQAQSVCTDTGPWCAACAEEWREHFNVCKHTWEPHQGDWGPGQYCTKCGGFVEDEDFAKMFGQKPAP